MNRSLLVACCLVATTASTIEAATRLKNICRVKGQEENVLRGQGLVVGLNGTGEANDPATMRAIQRAMEIMGTPAAANGQLSSLDELRKLKNVAFVWVEATVPATGARRGDRIDCFVSALNGKSLAGGRLAFASLQGPNTQDARVYALCHGQISVENPEQPMVGVVHEGCQLEADIFTPFHQDGFITLVLDKNHADFQTAAEIVYLIQTKLEYSEAGDGSSPTLVRALNAANIQVRIPDLFRHDPVGFAAEILDYPIEEPEPESRVVINPRAGTIVIGGDVEIGDVIVTHKNVVVEAEQSPGFSTIDVDGSSKLKLEQLVNQLNALKVPAGDIIEIIRGIDRNGKLHGRLIIE